MPIERIDLRKGQVPRDIDWEDYLNRAIDKLNAGILPEDLVKDASGRVAINISGDAATVGGYTPEQLIGGSFPDIKKTLIEFISGGNPVVLTGCTATKDTQTANKLNVEGGVVIQADSDGYITRSELSATSFTTAVPNTIYYLCVVAGGTDYYFGTSTPSERHAVLYEVYTNASANIDSIQDLRPTTAKIFNGFTAKFTVEKAETSTEAEKLKTARTISLTGDATGSTTFDGSADKSITVTLSNSGVTAGTYTKVTVDSKGRVTSGASATPADIGAVAQADFNTHVNNITHIPYAVATGSANSYSVTVNGITNYQEGLAIAVKINVDNTGASTININGLGARSIKKSNGNDLGAGNLKAGSVYTLRYNGTNFLLQGEGGSGNAQPSDVLSGKTFTNDSGEQTGIMPNNGAVIIIPSTQNQTIPVGYHNGSGYVVGDSNLLPENIVAGKSIFGVNGSYNMENEVWRYRIFGFPQPKNKTQVNIVDTEITLTSTDIYSPSGYTRLLHDPYFDKALYCRGRSPSGNIIFTFTPRNENNAYNFYATGPNTNPTLFFFINSNYISKSVKYKYFDLNIPCYTAVNSAPNISTNPIIIWGVVFQCSVSTSNFSYVALKKDSTTFFLSSTQTGIYGSIYLAYNPGFILPSGSYSINADYYTNYAIVYSQLPSDWVVNYQIISVNGNSTYNLTNMPNKKYALWFHNDWIGCLVINNTRYFGHYTRPIIIDGSTQTVGIFYPGSGTQTYVVYYMEIE